MTEQAIAHNPAGSAPATEAVEPKQFHEFSAEERSDYLKTLKPPKEEKPKTEESAPQETAATPEPEKPVESETESESAPEKPQEKAKGKAKGTGTPEEKRIPQLLSERNALEKRIAELEKKLQEGAAPKNAEPAPQPKANTLEAPKKPTWAEFQAQGKTFEEFDAAKDEYFEKLSEYKANKAVEADRQARLQEEANKAVAAKLDAAKQIYPDYEDVAKPFMAQLSGNIHPAVTEAIGRSPYAAHMLYVIGKDPAAAAA